MDKQPTAIISRSIWLGFFLGLWLIGAGPALSTTLDVHVVGRDGQALQYAAVMAGWSGAQPAKPARIPAVMSQQHIAFVPHMLIVPAGEEVSFPNRDRTRHHVYSFSRAKAFDIKLYIGRPQRPITFDKPGVVTLGCNIHDQMQAFIVSTDKPRWGITDTAGDARLSDLPDVPVTLSIWHPWMKSEQTRVRRVVDPGKREVTITLDVDPPPPPPKPTGPSLQDRFNSLAN